MYKASTLPTKASDTPETLFQREIAHFRYTKKKKLENSSSLAVQLSDSMLLSRDPRQSFDDEPWQPDGDLLPPRSRGNLHFYRSLLMTQYAILYVYIHYLI